MPPRKARKVPSATAGILEAVEELRREVGEVKREAAEKRDRCGVGDKGAEDAEDTELDGEGDVLLTRRAEPGAARGESAEEEFDAGLTAFAVARRWSLWLKYVLAGDTQAACMARIHTLLLFFFD